MMNRPKRGLTWLVLLLIAIPAVEIWGIVRMSGYIGGVPTLLLMIGTGVAGAWLAKREGTRAWREANREMQAGRPPGMRLLDGICIAAGGILLMIPGFATDLCGLFLLLPPTRRIVRAIIIGWLERRFRSGAGTIRRW